MQADDFKSRFKRLLENSQLPSDASRSAVSEMWNKIHSLLWPNIPSQLFRFRRCNLDTILSFEQGTISTCVADKFSDRYDSFIFVDKKRIQENIRLAFTSQMLEKLIGSAKNGELPAFIAKQWGTEMTTHILDFYKHPPVDADTMSKMLTDEFLPQFIEYIKSGFSLEEDRIRKDKLTKIACFTEYVNSKFMWDLYADGYKGFALEYDFTGFHHNGCAVCQETGCDKRNYSSLFPVLYSDIRYDASLLVEKLIIQNILKQYGIKECPPFPDQLYWYKAYLYKDIKEYSHEHEWRMINRCIATQNRDFSDISDQGCLKAIYYGPCIEERYRAHLSIIAKYRGIKEYMVDVDEEKPSYELNILPVE